MFSMNGAALTLKDVEIMQAVEVDGLTWPQTMEKIGVSYCAIARAKKKPEYRELVIAALEAKGKTPEAFASKLIQMLDKTREVNVNGELVAIDDNVAQTAALNKWGDILGVDAPKETNIRDITGQSDEELDREIAAAAEQFGLDERPEQPAMDAGNPRQIETDVLPVRAVFQPEGREAGLAVDLPVSGGEVQGEGCSGREPDRKIGPGSV
jgi:hypothetical protein